MAPIPGEIYQAQVAYRQSNDPRPVVILEAHPSNMVTVALISGALDLFNHHTHFILDPTHADFPATGLTKKCYIAGDELALIAVSCLLKKRGALKGVLAEQFMRWI